MNHGRPATTTYELVFRFVSPVDDMSADDAMQGLLSRLNHSPRRYLAGYHIIPTPRTLDELREDTGNER